MTCWPRSCIDQLPQMHLVLISRRDPPLPLSVLRARNMVAEVRVQDLQFFADEIAIFMQKMLGFPLPDAAIAGLLKRTEGWITSLRLVALALRYTDDIDNRLSALAGCGPEPLRGRLLDERSARTSFT